ncbi:helix-turn-helix domain-containing protein [Curvivirga sp.]|uniref:helix-turn-helix domain-containing protein n=1 Tax=Curvivirga sp. TaxID=2856848 RepID=UPI003B5B477B
MVDLNQNQNMALQFFRRLFSCWDDLCPDIALNEQLAAFGLNRADIVSGKQKVTIELYYRTLQLIAPSCWNRGFFLRLGDSYDIFDLGLVGYALVSTSNLQRSWELSSALVPHLIKTERQVFRDHVEILLGNSPLDDFQTIALFEEWLTSTWKWTCQRLPKIRHCPDVKIHLSFPEPAHSHVYSEIFPGQILFNQPNTLYSFPIEFNEKAFSSSNMAVSKLCFEQSLATLPLMQQASNLVDEVRLYLLQSANVAFANIKETAEYFGMPEHTFRRRLSRNDTTFRNVLYESRMTLARQYLLGTRLSINEIAYLTGYEHPPSFYRAFTKKYKTTPEQYRISG